MFRIRKIVIRIRIRILDPCPDFTNPVQDPDPTRFPVIDNQCFLFKYTSLLKKFSDVFRVFMEQWWLIGSNIRLSNCSPGLNPAISPDYSGLPVLSRAAIWDGTSLGCPLRGSRGEYKNRDFCSTKNN